MGFPALFLLFSTLVQAALPPDIARELVDGKKSAVPYAECRAVEERVGQLLYINVDGYGSRHAVDPYYLKLVERIQPGGVLPHYNSSSTEKIREASLALQAKSKLPLMIGIDYQRVDPPGAATSSGPSKEFRLGLGYGGGFLGSFNANTDPACVEKLARLQGELHRHLGINHPLGPTIEFAADKPTGVLSLPTEERRKFVEAALRGVRASGVETTVKHFPYTPDFNLHKENRDVKLPAADINDKYLPIYRETRELSGFMMSTHVYNSNVDPDEMVTFSRRWVDMVRQEVGFKGLLMTDALFMISSYNESMKRMARSWPGDTAGISDLTIFAAKAILSGHDMVFLESTAADTEKIYKNLIELSCRDGELSKELRERINTAYSRITSYKLANPQLKETPKLSNSEVHTALAALAKGEESCKALAAATRVAPATDINPLLFDCDVLGVLSQQPSPGATQRNITELARVLDHLTDTTVIAATIRSSTPDQLAALQTKLESDPQLKLRLTASARVDLQGGTRVKDAIFVLQKLEGFTTAELPAIEKILLTGDKQQVLALLSAVRSADMPKLSKAAVPAAIRRIAALMAESSGAEKLQLENFPLLLFRGGYKTEELLELLQAHDKEPDITFMLGLLSGNSSQGMNFALRAADNPANLEYALRRYFAEKADPEKCCTKLRLPERISADGKLQDISTSYGTELENFAMKFRTLGCRGFSSLDPKTRQELQQEFTRASGLDAKKLVQAHAEGNNKTLAILYLGLGADPEARDSFIEEQSLQLKELISTGNGNPQIDDLNCVAAQDKEAFWKKLDKATANRLPRPRPYPLKTNHAWLKSFLEGLQKRGSFLWLKIE